MVNVGKATGDVPDQGWGLYIVSVVMVIFSGLFVVSRLAVRISMRMMGADDYMIVAALVSLVLLTWTECMAVVNGYGKHTKDLTREQRITAFKWFFGAQIMYKVAVSLYKLSMLLLYLRIFPGRKYRLATWILFGLTVSFALAFTFGTVGQCTPIAAFWDKTLLKTAGAHCLPNRTWWFSFSIINICLDFAILFLPIYEMARLHLPLREKIALCGVFGLGIFVCATTIIRTTTLSKSAESTNRDPTWGIIPATIWSVVEPNTGTICACLPTLKKPLTLLFPRIFPSSYKSDSHRLFDDMPPIGPDNVLKAVEAGALGTPRSPGYPYPKQKENRRHSSITNFFSRITSEAHQADSITEREMHNLDAKTPLPSPAGKVKNSSTPSSPRHTPSRDVLLASGAPSPRSPLPVGVHTPKTPPPVLKTPVSTNTKIASPISQTPLSVHIDNTKPGILRTMDVDVNVGKGEGGVAGAGAAGGAGPLSGVGVRRESWAEAGDGLVVAVAGKRASVLSTGQTNTHPLFRRGAGDA